MLIIKSLLLGQRNPQYQQYDDLFFHLNLFPLFFNTTNCTAGIISPFCKLFYFNKGIPALKETTPSIGHICVTWNAECIKSTLTNV